MTTDYDFDSLNEPAGKTKPFTNLNSAIFSPICQHHLDKEGFALGLG
jgi:hypothetical protein